MLGGLRIASIKRNDIESITDFTGVKHLFKKMGFAQIKAQNDHQLKVSLTEDSLESILVIKIEDKSQINKFNKYITGVDVKYLSLVTSDFETFTFVRKEFTQAGTTRFKRFTFNKSGITNTTLKKLNNLNYGKPESFNLLFDTREVVQAFYIEFDKERKRLIKAIQGIENETHRMRYAQTILDRIIFLYFIEKKRLLNNDRDYLHNNFRNIVKSKGNYFTDFLKDLFFRALSEKDYTNSEYGTVPYLNGGLFAQNHIEIKYPDISINNEVFGTLLTFFDKYNWYVDEKADYGEETSISPEILGHIFEKTINTLSESGTGQKETGAYYTPEVITRYISENTIYPFVLNKINDKFGTDFKQATELFGEESTDSFPEEIALYLFYEVLPELSILDNACGSGAFLLAALEVTFDIWAKTLFNLLGSDALETLVKPYLEARGKDTNWLQYEFDDYPTFTLDPKWRYLIKRTIITNNIYGVDIEEGGIEIAKLRLWLAMVADVGDDPLDIEPLPNIEYNLRCGNSLFGFTSFSQLPRIFIDESDDMSDFLDIIQESHPKEIREIRDILKETGIENIVRAKQMLITLYKSEENRTVRLLLKKAIEKIILRLNKKMNFHFQAYVNRKITKPNDHFSENDIADNQAFHWVMEFPHIMAKSKNEEENGFDIIISNPPYLRVQQLQKTIPHMKKYIEAKYTIAEAAYDLAYIFFEHTMELSSKHCKNSYIFPHKFLNSAGGSTFRDYLINGTYIDRLAHFGANMVFEDADTYTCIALFSHEKNDGFMFQRFKFKSDWERLINKEERYIKIRYEQIKEASKLYGNNQWILFDDSEQFHIFKKIYHNSIKFEAIFQDIFQGLATSKDPLYIMDVTKKDDKYLTGTFPISGETLTVETGLFKPFLMGKDIQRYGPLNTNRFVFFPYEIIDGSANNLELSYIRKKYPKTHDYIMKYEEKFKARESGKAGKMEYWYNYIYPKNLTKFEQIKLSSMEICADHPNVTVNLDNFYHTTKVYSWVKYSHIKEPYEYYLAIANSWILWWFLLNTGDTLQGDARTFKTNYLNPFPIPNNPDPKISKEIICLVEEVLEQKKNDKLDTKEKETKIDVLVCQLYGLKPSEINCIRRSTGNL